MDHLMLDERCQWLDHIPDARVVLVCLLVELGARRMVGRPPRPGERGHVFAPLAIDGAGQAM